MPKASCLFTVITIFPLLTPSLAAQSASSEAPDTLREAADGHLLIGTAMSRADLEDPARARLIAAQFNCLTAENGMKPDALQEVEGTFTFDQADAFVDFAHEHDMAVIGHTLVWHNQAPRWLFEDADGKPLPREEALDNMRTHIHTVVRHFKGKVKGWDVVNEAISDSGPYLRDTPALRAIGEDYVVKAFQFAHEADPDVELYYNDYNIEAEYKRDKALRLIRELKAAGVRLDAVGIQGHWMLGGPDLAEVRAGIELFLAEDLPVMITELDVDPLPRKNAGGADVTSREEAGMDPYTAGLPDDAQRQLARRYADLFELFLSYPRITRVTFWGAHDGASWLNNFPVKGRTNHPLLWDRDLQPKPAFAAVMRTLRSKAARPVE